MCGTLSTPRDAVKPWMRRAIGWSGRADPLAPCRQYFVVEYNGDVYPRDFYVERDLKLGNVMTHTWEEMFASPPYDAFGKRKEAWNPDCEACPYCAVRITGDSPSRTAQSGGESEEGRGSAPLGRVRGEG